MVSKAHKERIEHYIQMGIDEDAELVVDGRGFTLQGHEQGFFIGPTFVRPCDAERARSSQGEIFGPVLQIVRAKDFEATVAHTLKTTITAMASRSSPATATPRANSPPRVNVGMVGINVPIPVPVSLPQLRRVEALGFGDIGQYGQEGLRFRTKNKVVTPALARRRRPRREHVVIIPTMG